MLVLVVGILHFAVDPRNDANRSRQNGIGEAHYVEEKLKENSPLMTRAHATTASEQQQK